MKMPSLWAIRLDNEERCGGTKGREGGLDRDRTTKKASLFYFSGSQMGRVKEKERKKKVDGAQKRVFDR